MINASSHGVCSSILMDNSKGATNKAVENISAKLESL
jgi:hypothetical protein